MYVQQKFILHYVSPIETTDRGNVQNIQLMLPAKTDEFGDKFGEDHIYDVRCYNKDLMKLPDLMKIRLGSVVKCSVYISSRKVVTQTGKEFYQPYITLKNIEIIKNDGIQTNQN
jgi:hypothetical protein